jgi:hypothetical protein
MGLYKSYSYKKREKETKKRVEKKMDIKVSEIFKTMGTQMSA